MKTLLIAFLVVIPATARVVVASSFDMKALAACRAFATSQEPAPAEAEATCLGPATEGLPSAQYALGAILLSHQKFPEGLKWLETAAASHHPPASHLLAEIYLQTKEAALQERGKELLRYAVCTGYPPALASEHRAALGTSIDCTPSVAVNFDGSWVGQLTWSKTAPGGGSIDQLRVVISSEPPKVYMRSKGDWTEVKPGKFTAHQADETLIVSALDSGWDLDGKWVESWTIHLLRVGPNEAVMNFFRTVNNVYLPESTGFKTFSTVAEGRAIRTDK